MSFVSASGKAEIAEDVLRPPCNFKLVAHSSLLGVDIAPFVHESIVRSRASRERISSMSFCGVLMPRLDFSGKASKAFRAALTQEILLATLGWHISQHRQVKRSRTVKSGECAGS